MGKGKRKLGWKEAENGTRDYYASSGKKSKSQQRHRSMHINRWRRAKCMWGSGHMSRNSILQLVWPRTLFIIHRGHRTYTYVSPLFPPPSCAKRGPIPTFPRPPPLFCAREQRNFSSYRLLFSLIFSLFLFLSSLDGRNNEKRSYTTARRGTAGRAIFLITYSLCPREMLSFFFLFLSMDGIWGVVDFFFNF